jgi:hypothetical protein
MTAINIIKQKNAVQTSLRLDGFDPATIAPRDGNAAVEGAEADTDGITFK